MVSKWMVGPRRARASRTTRKPGGNHQWSPGVGQTAKTLESVRGQCDVWLHVLHDWHGYFTVFSCGTAGLSFRDVGPGLEFLSKMWGRDIYNGCPLFEICGGWTRLPFPLWIRHCKWRDFIVLLQYHIGPIQHSLFTLHSVSIYNINNLVTLFGFSKVNYFFHIKDLRRDKSN